MAASGSRNARPRAAAAPSVPRPAWSGGPDRTQHQEAAAAGEGPGRRREAVGRGPAEDHLGALAEEAGSVVEEQTFELRVAQPAPGGAADLEGVGQGEEFGGGGVEGREAAGAVDHEDGVGHRVDEAGQPGLGRLGRHGRVRRPQAGRHRRPEHLQGLAADDVGRLGHE